MHLIFHQTILMQLQNLKYKAYNQYTSEYTLLSFFILLTRHEAADGFHQRKEISDVRQMS